jgi:methanogenic corrinoid protein MtbC1
MAFSEKTNQLGQALLAMDRVRARAVLEESAAKQPFMEILEEMMIPAFVRIGELWEAGQVALSQIYMSSRICEEIIEEFLPPGAAARKRGQRIGIAVLADHHLLGKRIVLAVLRAGGYELVDYGQVQTAKSLAEMAVRDRLDVLLISTLMLRGARDVENVRLYCNKRDWPLKIVVGGAPFLLDPGLWREVGADAMAPNAAATIKILQKLEGGAVYE